MTGLPLPEWFYEALKRGKERAGSRVALARALGVKHPTIMDWEDGAVPGLDNALRLLEYAGSDLSLVLVSESLPQEPVCIVGRVSAGAKSTAFEEPRRLDGISSAWKRSVYWPLCAAGLVVYLEVDGNSMEPDYPDGCLLACARPAGGPLPDLTPVIARVLDQATFKLYSLGRDRQRRPEVELIPINRTYKVQRHDPKEVSIDYIVLGVANPWKHGVASEPKAPIFKDSGG